MTSLTDALLEIRYGKSKATMVDPTLLSKLLAQYPELKVMKVPLQEHEKSEGCGICCRKELVEEVRGAVKELREEGTLQALEKKWGLND